MREAKLQILVLQAVSQHLIPVQTGARAIAANLRND